jgi:uncharacterized protein
MFQTLGNLELDDRVGLLFIDWETGATLQVSGWAELVWDDREVARRSGAERVLRVEVGAVVERERSLAFAWRLVEQA